MSRYMFSTLCTNAEKLLDENQLLEDTLGYGLSDWINKGVVGWDEPMDSYFIQLDLGHDEPVWWIGTERGEIPNFTQLCKMINSIFNVSPDTFSFSWPDQPTPEMAPKFQSSVSYFFNAEGNYQSKIYLNTQDEALELVFRFKAIVPKIMVTESDMSVMESEGGQITHPPFDAHMIATMESKYPPIQIVPFDQALQNYHHNTEALGDCETIGEEQRSRIRHSEYYLMAIAAREGINLYDYDYTPAEMLLTQLEEVY